MGKKIPSYKKNALLAGVVILFILSASLAALILFPRMQAGSQNLTALVYQDGILLYQIDLNNVPESRQFTITDGSGNFNLIEVRPGSIGITDASCPDKLCVHMGFQASSLLPIICLPNKLVIRITAADITDSAPQVDGVAY
ncbi:MAG: NusG domain II-containing protein [Lachnospiraceae bacterium]|nr:NusG domain II-containing protein [Lachnospiraceae bacterium]